MLPGAEGASRWRPSRVVSFACELLRVCCWAAAARVRRRLETRAQSYLASLLHAMQKRLQASYGAGARRVQLKLAQPLVSNVFKLLATLLVLTFGLDAARCRQCPALVALLSDGDFWRCP